jgi:hypothetical protein
VRRVVLIAVLCIFCGFSAASQPDSISTKLQKHSTKRATLYSTFLPGLGQLYNKQAWKIPVIYGAGTVVTYLAITNHNGAKKFKTEYLSRVNGGVTNPDYANWTDEGVLAKYNEYEQAFELSIIVGGVFYLINIIDALVYAHLFSFDISDSLSAHINPLYCPHQGLLQSSPTLGLSITFSLK